MRRLFSAFSEVSGKTKSEALCELAFSMFSEIVPSAHLKWRGLTGIFFHNLFMT